MDCARAPAAECGRLERTLGGRIVPPRKPARVRPMAPIARLRGGPILRLSGFRAATVRESVVQPFSISESSKFMEKRTLGNTAMNVTVLGYGAAEIGFRNVP